MRVSTTDRGEVLAVAGRAHLSPALVEGVPRLVPHGENAGRVGWAAFFDAMERGGLVVAWDTDEPSSAAAVAGAGAPPPVHASLATGVDRARRFWTSFRGGPAAG